MIATAAAPAASVDAEPTMVDVLTAACVRAADHLAQVRGSSFEAVAQRDLDAFCARLVDARAAA